MEATTNCGRGQRGIRTSAMKLFEIQQSEDDVAVVTMLAIPVGSLYNCIGMARSNLRNARLSKDCPGFELPPS